MIQQDIFDSKQLNERLTLVVENIVSEFHPTKIYLFGSYARGTFDIDTSEIDILIIGETTMKFMDRIKCIRILCSGEPHINPLMYTNSEIEQLEQDGEGFVDDVMEEGILLYDSNSAKVHS